MPDGTTKISANLADDAIAVLKRLAAKRNVTVTDVLRTAISTENYLDKVRTEEGAKVLVEDKNGRVRELVFQR